MAANRQPGGVLVSGQGPSAPQDRAGLLAGAIRELQLWWRLLRDPRVPLWTRAIPLLTVLYILFPVDLIVDPLLGLGQLDDLAVFVVGMGLFVSLSPAEVVDQIRRDILAGRRSTATAGGPKGDVQTVDAAYRVVDDGAEVASTGGRTGS